MLKENAAMQAPIYFGRSILIKHSVLIKTDHHWRYAIWKMLLTAGFALSVCTLFYAVYYSSQPSAI